MVIHRKGGGDMRSSRGEIKIEEILTQANLNFEQEYSFADLVGYTKHPLR